MFPNLPSLRSQPYLLSAYPLFMSTGIDARRRPNLWSYISFGSTPRRRSISLLTRNSDGRDTFQRDDFAKTIKVDISGEKGAWMTPAQRSRYYKTGGIIAFVFFILYLLSGRDAAHVGDLVPGRRSQSVTHSAALCSSANALRFFRPWRSKGV